MNVTLIFVGKTVKSFLREGEAEYEKRLKKYVKVKELIIPELKKASKLSESEIKKAEGKLILDKVMATDKLILLDERGNEFSSVGFSKEVQKLMNSGVKNVIFVVGGAYGFSDDVYSRANQKLSLSKMTFSHQMVRMIFKEQLYRAFSILNNEPYHHR